MAAATMLYSADTAAAQPGIRVQSGWRKGSLAGSWTILAAGMM